MIKLIYPAGAGDYSDLASVMNILCNWQATWLEKNATEIESCKLLCTRVKCLNTKMSLSPAIKGKQHFIDRKA